MVRIFGFPDEIAETPQGIPPLDHPDRAARVSAWEDWANKVLAYRVERKEMVEAVPDLIPIEQRYCSDPDTGKLYWILMYCYIFEPRAEDEVTADGPWILFPFQIDFLLWVDSLKYQKGAKRDGIVPKSRDMGASWLLCADSVWKWMFTYPAQERVVSWRGDEVDARSPDALFSKMDYLIERQPQWLLPVGFQWEEARHRKEWVAPNKNAIVGQASTERAMRGGRAGTIKYDEAAINRFFQDSWESTTNVAPVRIAASSVHLDYNTLFQELAFSVHMDEADTPSRFLMHYWLHPYHDEEWVAEQRSRNAMSPGKFEREVLMDARAGNTTIVYPMALDKAPEDIHFIPGAPLWVGIDPGHADATAVVWMQEHPDGHMHILNAYMKQKMTADFWGTILRGTPHRKQKDWGISYQQIVEMEYIGVTGKWEPVGEGLGEDGEEWTYTEQEYALMEWVQSLPKPTGFYGDMSGKSTLGASKDTFYKRLAGFGISVNRDRIETGQVSAERMEARTYLGRQTATKAVLPRMRFADTFGAKLCLRAFQNYRWPGNDRPRSREPMAPLHDEHSHLVTAVEYVLVNLSILRRVHTTKKKHRATAAVTRGREYLSRRAGDLGRYAR